MYINIKKNKNKNKLSNRDCLLQGDIMIFKIKFIKNDINIDNLKKYILKNCNHPFRIYNNGINYNYMNTIPKIYDFIPLNNFKEIYESNNQAINFFIKNNTILVIFDHGYIEGISIVNIIINDLLNLNQEITYPTFNKTYQNLFLINELYFLYLQNKKKTVINFKSLKVPKYLDFNTIESIRKILKKIIDIVCQHFKKKQVSVKTTINFGKSNNKNFNNLSYIDVNIKKGSTINFNKKHFFEANVINYMAGYLKFIPHSIFKNQTYKSDIILSIINLLLNFFLFLVLNPLAGIPFFDLG